MTEVDRLKFSHTMRHIRGSWHERPADQRDSAPHQARREQRRIVRKEQVAISALLLYNVSLVCHVVGVALVIIDRARRSSSGHW